MVSSALSSMPTVVGSSPRMPSGPAKVVARVSTMNCRCGRQLVAGAGDAVGTESHERIVGLQRDEHGAVAALLHQVEAVVEELAEEHEPQVEGRGQALVGRHVVERELGNIVLGAGDAVQTAPSPG